MLGGGKWKNTSLKHYLASKGMRVKSDFELKVMQAAIIARRRSAVEGMRLR